MSSSASAQVSVATAPDRPFHSFDGETLSNLEATALATPASSATVAKSVMKESCEPSVLAEFDAGYMLDALSFGIVVLDKQLCVIYANVVAQDLLTLDLPSLRGRPLADFLPQLTCFTHAVRVALESGAAVDYTLHFGRECSPQKLQSNKVEIRPVCNRMSGAYFLVELSARTCGG